MAMFRSPLRAALAVVAWMIVWLVVFDIAAHAAIRYLAARHVAPTLVRYFDYGTSIETKLDRTTRLPVDAEDALILRAGWLDPSQWRDLPQRPAPGADMLVAVYGQSFAHNVMREVGREDGHLTVRALGGPAAPPDHSYASVLADDDNRQAGVIVFGILASSVPHMGAMSGIDWTFEHPAPYTYPRYTLRDGQLVAEPPVLATEGQFRTAFAEGGPAWTRFKAQLARNDVGFDPLVFDRTWLDGSQLALLMRRGWVAHTQDYARGIYDPATGFDAHAPQIQVLQAMLVDLKRRTQARGQRFVVLLEQDQGFGDSLERVLGPTLRGAGVEYVSTHTIFSADDPRNFKPDGHYTDAANERFAQRLLSVLRPRH